MLVGGVITGGGNTYNGTGLGLEADSSVQCDWVEQATQTTTIRSRLFSSLSITTRNARVITTFGAASLGGGIFPDEDDIQDCAEQGGT